MQCRLKYDEKPIVPAEAARPPVSVLLLQARKEPQGEKDSE
jgi:hypothetical protein